MIYPFCQMFMLNLCLSITHCFVFCFALFCRISKKKNLLIDRRDKQEHFIQKKFVTTFTDVFRFYCSFSPCLVQFSSFQSVILFHLFFCAMLNLTSHFESMNYATMYCGSQRVCVFVYSSLFIRSLIYALKPDTLHLLAVVTFFSLFSK